ncbi:hypothetical protein [Paenibacillus sp. FSL W8-1287]|uniref:hypothetical protein n=1 Tax=Paenibacillus sp. FSL W8-1287 TaxID=2954653 RepID=UPI0030CEE7A3
MRKSKSDVLLEKVRRDREASLRFITTNTYGEFCFYVTEDLLREFLDSYQMVIGIDFFSNYYTPEQSKALFDWLKTRDRAEKKL